MFDPKELKNLSDEELALECTIRPINENAWIEFWRRFYPILRQRIVSILSPFGVNPHRPEIEDILQLVFMKVFNNLHLYEQGKAPLRAYINTIATHTVFDQLRHARVKSMALDKLVQNNQDICYSDEFEVGQLWQIVLKTLEELEPKKRRIIESFLEGRNREEICIVNSIPASVLSTNIYRFKKKIQKIFKKK